jgi:WD40 repeat protein
MIQGACNMNGFFVRLAIPTVLASIVLILTTGKPAQGQAPPANALPAPILRLEADGPTARLTALAFSPDGQTLYAAGFDKVIRVWKLDPPSGRFVLDSRAYRVPIGPGRLGIINTLAISPDGAWLAASGRGLYRHMADFSTPGRVIEGTALDVEAEKDEGTIYLFETRKQTVRFLRGHSGTVVCMAFAPHAAEPLLVSAAEEPGTKPTVGRLCQWDIARALSWDQKGRLQGGKALLGEWVIPNSFGNSLGLAVCPADARARAVRVALAWGDGKLRIWNTDQSGKGELPFAADGAAPWNNTVAWISSSQFLTGGAQTTGGRLRVWRDTGMEPSPQRELLLVPDSRSSYLPRALALFSANPGAGITHAAAIVRTIGTPVDNYGLIIVKLDNLEHQGAMIPLWRPTGNMPILASSPNGRYLAAAGSGDHAIWLYSIDGLLKNRTEPDLIRSVGMNVKSVAFIRKDADLALALSPTASPDSAPSVADYRLAFDFSKRTLTTDPAGAGWKLDSPSDWRYRSTVTNKGEHPPGLIVEWQGPGAQGQTRVGLETSETATALALVPPSKWSPKPVLAVASWDAQNALCRLRLIDAVTLEPLRALTAHTMPIRSLAASSDGKLLASAADDQTVCVWSLTDLNKVQGQHSTLRGLKFMPAEKAVIIDTVDQDRSLSMSLKAGDRLLGFPGRRGNGLLAFESSLEMFEKLWGLTPGKEVTLQVERQGKPRLEKVRLQQGTDERKPLLSLFIVSDSAKPASQWIAWTPVGPYDSSDSDVERYIGWQFNAPRLGDPVKFGGADAYRRQFREPALLKPLLELGDIQSALERIKKPLPRPSVQLELDAPVMEPTREKNADRVVRTADVTLRATIVTPSLEKGQVEAAWWQLDDEKPRPLALDQARGQQLFQPVHLPADRKVHSILVRLLTREAQAQEETKEIQVRYVPLPPRIQLDEAWVAKNFNQPGELRGAVRRQSFELEAQVAPGQSDQNVEIALVRKERETAVAGPEVKLGLDLEEGLNALVLRARNQGARDAYERLDATRRGYFEGLETSIRRFELSYKKPLPPKLRLDTVQAVGQDAIRRPLPPDDVLDVETPRVRIDGTIDPVSDVERIDVLNPDGSRRATGKLARNGFSAELALTAGEQQFSRVRATLTDKQFVETPLRLRYLPPLPSLDLTEPATDVTIDNWRETPVISLKGRLHVTAEYQQFTVEVQANGSNPTTRTFTDAAAAGAGQPIELAKVKLRPGLNRINVRLKNEWRTSPALTRLVAYRRPPVINGAIRLAPIGKRFADVTVLAETPSDLSLTQVRANDQVYEPATVAHEVSRNEGRTTWEIRVKRLPLRPGADAVRMAIDDGEGVATATALPPDAASEWPRFTFEPQGVSSKPVTGLSFTVSSPTRLTAVELLRGDNLLKSLDVGSQTTNAQEFSELKATCQVSLTPGTNVFRLLASDEDGGRREDKLTVSFVPPTVKLSIVDGPPPVAQGPNLRVRCSVSFQNLEEAISGQPKLFGMRIFVNDFQQRAVSVPRLDQDKSPPTVQFDADLVLNQQKNKIVFEFPPELHPEANQTLEYSVDCAQPSKPAILHLLVAAVDEHDRARLEELARQALRALQAEVGNGSRIQSKVFKEVLMYPKDAAMGLVDTCDVDKELTNIRDNIRTRGSPSDVVLIYWLGRDITEESGQWYLPGKASLPGESLSRTGIPLSWLLAAEQTTPGARVLLLDVDANDGKEEIAVSSMNSAHAAVLRYQWSRKGNRVPGLLKALENAAQRRDAVTLKEFRLGAQELSHKYSAIRKLDDNFRPPLSDLTVAGKPSGRP